VTSPPQRPPESPEPEEFTSTSGARRLLWQFFLVPLLVVAVCVGIFFLFSMLTFERKSPSDYLADVRGGAANQRWQSAFELSRVVARIPPGPERDRLGAQTLEIFEHLREGRAEDRDVKRYLALVLGRLHYAPAAPALRAATRDPDDVVGLYSVWALGMLGDRGAVSRIVEYSSAEDPGARKMAAYVLGKLGDPAAVPRLTAMTGDPVADVRWNAAIALAELHDPAGRDVLHSMLDRASLARQARDLTPPQAQEAIVNALKAEVLLGDRTALPAIRELEMKDSDMTVRDAARRARKALEPPA
jgi:HEAT repeat protein